jgi:hypothetical protein
LRQLIFFVGPLWNGPAAGRGYIQGWLSEFEPVPPPRHPGSEWSDAGSEEEKMSNTDIHLTLKSIRLLELCEAEGFEKLDDLLLASIDDSVCPAICMECGCTADMEPDQREGYCEQCGKNKVVSCLVLADLI